MHNLIVHLYKHTILERTDGLEPATCSLEGCHSTHLSYVREFPTFNKNYYQTPDPVTC